MLTVVEVVGGRGYATYYSYQFFMAEVLQHNCATALHFLSGRCVLHGDFTILMQP